jgi:DNA-binding CsgD family transcriptional regulator
LLVLFRDVMQAERVDPSFARIYQLTPAEMKLCDGLLSGLSLAEIAASRAIAIDTARHQLKTIFAKTGTNRQVELVRLMSAFG